MKEKNINFYRWAKNQSIYHYVVEVNPKDYYQSNVVDNKIFNVIKHFYPYVVEAREYTNTPTDENILVFYIKLLQDYNKYIHGKENIIKVFINSKKFKKVLLRNKINNL